MSKVKYVFNDVDPNAYSIYSTGISEVQGKNVDCYFDDGYFYPDGNCEAQQSYLLYTQFLTSRGKSSEELIANEIKPINDAEVWQLSIDLIGVEIPRDALQGSRFKEFCNTKGYNFLFKNQFVHLEIHPEWNPHITQHSVRVLTAFIDLCKEGVFTYPYAYLLYKLFSMYIYDTSDNMAQSLALVLNSLFPFYCLEIAMDFRHAKVFDTINTHDFLKYYNTYYSRKDYRKYVRKSGKREGKQRETQKSFIKIYDWAAKHNGTVPTQRLEFGFYGKYRKMIPDGILANDTENICKILFPTIKAQMWNLTFPTHLVFFNRWINPVHLPFFYEFYQFLDWKNYEREEYLARRRKTP